jgi:4-amino-4-deoxy-L-arabinose transferase-like glycosyltransferase
MSDSLLIPHADFFLQFFVCVGVVVGALWLEKGDSWHLPALAVLLGAAVLTKREGVLLAAILLLALAIASTDRRRHAWPAIGAVALTVAAAALPWRIWYRVEGIEGDVPTSFALGRTWDALWLALEVTFDTTLWSVLTALVVAAVVLAAIRGDRRQALFFGLLVALVVLGGAWISVAFSDLPLSADESVNPIVRYTGAVALVAGLATPLLLAGVWARARVPEDTG